jgi:hypothetical protein
VRNSQSEYTTFLYDLYSIDTRRVVGQIDNRTYWNTQWFVFNLINDYTLQRDGNFRVVGVNNTQNSLIFLLDNENIYKQRVRALISLEDFYTKSDIDSYISIVSELNRLNEEIYYEIAAIYPRTASGSSLPGTFLYFNR